MERECQNLRRHISAALGRINQVHIHIQYISYHGQRHASRDIKVKNRGAANEMSMQGATYDYATIVINRHICKKEGS